MFASLLIMTLCFTASNSNAQAKDDSSKMKDYCMMKDGKNDVHERRKNDANG